MKIRRARTVGIARTGKAIKTGLEGVRWNVFLSLLIILLTCCSTASLQAQCALRYDGFQPGEKVVYSLSFNWEFVWVEAGEATLELAETTYDARPAYRMDLIVAGNKRADFFFKLRDTLTSVMSPRLEPLYYRKGAVEGKRYWVDQAFFSYIDGVSHVKQVRWMNNKTTEYHHNDSRCIYDLLSVLAWARTINIDNNQPGDEITIPVATGRRLEEQNLVYRGRSQYKAENGTVYNCLKFSLVGNRKDKNKEVMSFNITDDRNRLPIHIDIHLNFGAAKASLLRVTGSKYGYGSIVE